MLRLFAPLKGMVPVSQSGWFSIPFRSGSGRVFSDSTNMNVNLLHRHKRHPSPPVAGRRSSRTKETAWEETGFRLARLKTGYLTPNQKI